MPPSLCCRVWQCILQQVQGLSPSLHKSHMLTKHSNQIFAVLTVSVYVSKFIVQVKQASDAVLHGGNWPVSRKDVFVELKMWR